MYIYIQTYLYTPETCFDLWQVFQISVNPKKTLLCPSHFQTWMLLGWFNQNRKGYHRNTLFVTEHFSVLVAAIQGAKKHLCIFTRSRPIWTVWFKSAFHADSKIGLDMWSTVTCSQESSQQTLDATSQSVGKGSVWSEADQQHGRGHAWFWALPPFGASCETSLYSTFAPG